MRCQGKITEWNDERGFGFVVPEEGGKRVFLHIKSFVSRPRRPVINDVVTYMLKTDERGRLQAGKVSFYVKPERIYFYFLKNIFFIFLAILFLSFVGFSAFYEKLPLLIIVYYVALCGITFLAYSFDKSAAEDGGWRVPESTLHLFSIIGGWPGALLAQVFIRHKSKKQSFRNVFWVTVGLNCILLFFVFMKTTNNI
jgi:uncharacterized membrane protein YsdA (DUF1294 family)/cold shock CspA family protein